MWERFKRAMRSFAGFFVSSIEDPELILEQNIRDMNDQVPKMNESIAMVRANVTLLEKENSKYKVETGDLTAKVKAAIQAGRDDLAAQYATRLQMEKGALIRNEGQLSTARAANTTAPPPTKSPSTMPNKNDRPAPCSTDLVPSRCATWPSSCASTPASSSGVSDFSIRPSKT